MLFVAKRCWKQLLFDFLKDSILTLKNQNHTYNYDNAILRVYCCFVFRVTKFLDDVTIKKFVASHHRHVVEKLWSVYKLAKMTLTRLLEDLIKNWEFLIRIFYPVIWWWSANHNQVPMTCDMARLNLTNLILFVQILVVKTQKSCKYLTKSPINQLNTQKPNYNK